jgi:hypothetical protein
MAKVLRASSLVTFGLLIMIAAPVFAHHGNAAMDTSKRITVTGTITEWVWANPHCWLKMDVTDDKGNVVHWVMEENAPSTLVGFGFTRQSFKPGDKATVTMIVAKNGQRAGRPNKIVVNGKTYSVYEGSAQDSQDQ